jgi:hypothetical protein
MVKFLAVKFQGVSQHFAPCKKPPIQSSFGGLVNWRSALNQSDSAMLSFRSSKVSLWDRIEHPFYVTVQGLQESDPRHRGTSAAAKASVPQTPLSIPAGWNLFRHLRNVICRADFGDIGQSDGVRKLIDQATLEMARRERALAQRALAGRGPFCCGSQN